MTYQACMTEVARKCSETGGDRLGCLRTGQLRCRTPLPRRRVSYVYEPARAGLRGLDGITVTGDTLLGVLLGLGIGWFMWKRGKAS